MSIGRKRIGQCRGKLIMLWLERFNGFFRVKLEELFPADLVPQRLEVSVVKRGEL